jgi:hypothetical protein
MVVIKIMQQNGILITLGEYEALQREIFRNESKVADSEYAMVEAYIDIHNRAFLAGGPESDINGACDGIERMQRLRSETVKIIIDMEERIDNVVANCRRRGVPEAALAGLVSLGADIGVWFVSKKASQVML